MNKSEYDLEWQVAHKHYLINPCHITQCYIKTPKPIPIKMQSQVGILHNLFLIAYEYFS